MKSPAVYHQCCYVLSIFLFVPHKKRIRSLLLKLSLSLEVHLCFYFSLKPYLYDLLVTQKYTGCCQKIVFLIFKNSVVMLYLSQ